MLDLTTAFVRDGLAGQRVVWLAEEPARSLAELDRRGVVAQEATTAGRIMVMTCKDGLLDGQAFTAEHATRWLRDQMDAPRARVIPDYAWRST